MTLGGELALEEAAVLSEDKIQNERTNELIN